SLRVLEGRLGAGRVEADPAAAGGLRRQAPDQLEVPVRYGAGRQQLPHLPDREREDDGIRVDTVERQQLVRRPALAGLDVDAFRGAVLDGDRRDGDVAPYLRSVCLGDRADGLEEGVEAADRAVRVPG